MLKVGEVVKGAHGQYKITGELTDNYRWKLYKAIDYTDKEFLLHCFLDNDERLKQNIYNLFTRHLPPALKSDKFFFAYPEDFIRTCEYFGFCMPYINMSDSCACGDIIFSSEPLEYEALVNVSKNIIAAFEALHNSGYCFKSFSYCNVYINIRTGFVSIMDVENITTPNNRSGQSVLGTEGWIAPEIVRGMGMPDTQTDRFSVSVLLFYLWVRHNPFEGRKHAACEPNDYVGKWGNPVFIFHPTDKSNSVETDPPDAPNQYALARTYWNAVPPALKKLFTQAFTDGLDKNRRILEYRWNEVFREIEAGFAKCKCGHTALTGGLCLFCGKQI